MRKSYKFLILKVLVIILIVPFKAQSQVVLYNPQTLYDAPGGFYDQSMIREMNIQFYDANYHNILRNAFFNNPAYRIPAVVSLDGMSYDSVGVRYKGNSTFVYRMTRGILRCHIIWTPITGSPVKKLQIIKN